MLAEIPVPVSIDQMKDVSIEDNALVKENK